MFRWVGWLIWLLAVIFYAYEFFLRISPAVITQDLMLTFSVDAQHLGNLSAYYYYAYALMQIPAGILIDRYGVRKMLTLGAALVTLGTFFFVLSDNLFLAEFGRILMGAGSSFAFVSCLKIGASWFANKHFALIVGLTNTIGVIGALTGGAPLAYWVELFGWRSTMWQAVFLGVIITVAIALFIRDQPHNPKQKQQDLYFCQRSIKQALLQLLSSQKTWLFAIYGGLMVAPIAAFTELWAVQFLTDVHNMDRITAALLSSVVFIGIAIGGPIHGWVANNRWDWRKVMLLGNLLALLSLLVLLYSPITAIFSIFTCLFVFGFMTSSMLLSFSTNVEINPADMKGAVIGFTNTLVMLGGTIFQPLTGYLLDLRHGQAHYIGGLPSYTVSDYHFALSLLPMCQVAGLVVLITLFRKVK